VSKLRVYVCAPMSGLPHLNIPAIQAATTKLRALGYEVVSPAEINAGQNPDQSAMTPLRKRAIWMHCMRKCIPELITCDWLVALPGYDFSEGCGIEITLAMGLGIRCEALEDFLASPPAPHHPITTEAHA